VILQDAFAMPRNRQVILLFDEFNVAAACRDFLCLWEINGKIGNVEDCASAESSALNQAEMQ
jgi:hypothetical protein